ncbi:MAG: HAD-IC family P-type ATPase [Patescibacteria group bacterium]
MRTSKAGSLHDDAEAMKHWHAHGRVEVLAFVESTEQGLSDEVVQKRLKILGPNAFTEVKTESLFIKLFKQLKSPLVFVLVIAAVITLLLEEYIDAGVISFALLIAVAVGLVQEGKASRAFKKLADSQEHIAYVIRGGKKFQVPSRELVVGDIIELQSGMQVPADLRLLSQKNLSINESALTGEWLAVDKQVEPLVIGTEFAEQTNMAWMGTFVADGRGVGVVVATGDTTAVGVLAAGLTGVEEEKTPLQHEMADISNVMLYIIMALVVAIFSIGLWQGQPFEEMLLMAIAIAVASVPEGLPAAVTIILAVGMEALLKRGGLVRNLLAAETLGSTTFVLTDKTGTLTQGKMALTGVIVNGEERHDNETWRDDVQLYDLLNIALCASDAFFDEKADAVRGDPVEAAILAVAKDFSITPEQGSYRSYRKDFLPFTSEQRFAAGLARHHETNLLCINGAPQHLLRHSDRYRDRDGIKQLTGDVRQRFVDQIEHETSMGRRLIAVAFKDVAYDDIPDDGNGVLEQVVFAGVLVFTDPVRDGVAEAIAGVQSAGARVLLITGDNPATARSIAEKVGIVTDNKQVIVGKELPGYSDQEIEALIDQGVSVFARVLPKQKMRIAQLLQRRGEIVAMTGDGINDAPALRKANIGVAIGSGTEVAKESSDLVLVNDTFATIYAAIEEGRRIISNLRKIVGYLLSTSLSEVVLIGAALITGAPAPISAAQILWANVIEEGFMSVAFAFEKGEKDAMQRKPQDIHEEGILSKDMMWFMAFAITILSGLSLALYFYLRSLGIPFEELRSAMFLSIAMDSLFMAFAFRSLSTPIWKIPLRTNLFFVFSFIVSAGMLAIVLSVPLFQRFLDYTPLPLFDIVLVVGVSVLSLFTIEFGKYLFFERRN